MFENIILYGLVAMLLWAMLQVMWITMVAEFGVVGTLCFWTVAGIVAYLKESGK